MKVGLRGPACVVVGLVLATIRLGRLGPAVQGAAAGKLLVAEGNARAGFKGEIAPMLAVISGIMVVVNQGEGRRKRRRAVAR